MKKRQVIFIMTDTQRTDMLGCYGNSAMVTPNLDRLGQREYDTIKPIPHSLYVSLQGLRFLQEATLIPVPDGRTVWDFPIMYKALDSA